MKKGTSFVEVMVAILLISISLVVFLKIPSDYLRTLVFAKEMFVLGSSLQEKYQLAIAYRNKFLEDRTNNWFSDGNFCFEFDTSTSKIITSTPPCEQNFLSGSKSKIAYLININSTANEVKIKIFASTTKFATFKIDSKLEGFLTKWHPYLNF